MKLIKWTSYTDTWTGWLLDAITPPADASTVVLVCEWRDCALTNWTCCPRSNAVIFSSTIGFWIFCPQTCFTASSQPFPHNAVSNHAWFNKSTWESLQTWLKYLCCIKINKYFVQVKIKYSYFSIYIRALFHKKYSKGKKCLNLMWISLLCSFLTSPHKNQLTTLSTSPAS